MIPLVLLCSLISVGFYAACHFDGDEDYDTAGKQLKLHTPIPKDKMILWWVRYYADGKILRRTTKETSKQRAIEYAKGFYDEINYKRLHGVINNSGKATFTACATALLEQQDALVARDEMSAMMQQNDRYRLRKEVLPFFERLELKDIDYFKLEQFINQLGLLLGVAVYKNTMAA